MAVMNHFNVAGGWFRNARLRSVQPSGTMSRHSTAVMGTLRLLLGNWVRESLLVAVCNVRASWRVATCATEHWDALESHRKRL